MNELRIDQLPYLCLKRIFKHLSVKDLAKCRAVNRLFKFYAEDTALVELIAVKDTWWDRRDHWILTNRPLNFDNQISWNAFSCFKSSPFKLDQLKFLQICLPHGADMDGELVSRFKQLVHLEIRMLGEFHSAQTLDLPNLKMLWFHDHGSYVLKTPKLEVLKCQAADRFQFDHPETIKQLECTQMSNQTAKFKNLEVLKCECLGFDLSAMPLSDWSKLTELAIEHSDRVDHEAFESWMIDLMRQRDALRRAEPVKIFLDDVPMVDVNQLSEREFMPRHIFQFKNHRLLRRKSYPEHWDVRFGDLVGCGVEFSSDFFVRFPTIGDVSARGLTDPDAFEWFLKNAKSMYSLELVYTSLNQSFFDRLPSIINSRLANLSMWGISHLVTNFDFILQFKQLATFTTDHQFDSLEFVAKAYRQLYDLYHLRFCAGDEEVLVVHRGPIKNDYELSLSVRKGHWSLRTFSRDNLKLSELVTLYDQLSAPAARKARKEWADGVDMAELIRN